MINKELYHFVSQYQKKNTEITDTSEVLNVLNINGDGIFEFMKSYSRQFGVDIANFDYNLYLNPASPYYLPLTIGNLNKGLIVGYLDSSVVDGDYSDVNMPVKQSTRSVIVAVVLCIIIAAVLGFVTYYI